MRLTAIRASEGERSILVFSVYKPVDTADNLSEFTDYFGIRAVRDNMENDSVAMLGGSNANPAIARGQKSPKIEEQKITEKNPDAGDVKVMPKKSFHFGVRHLQMVCMFLTTLSLYVARSCMGVAVLAMSDERRKNDTTITIYNWDKKTQSVILSSFFWGYVTMHIPAGILAKKFGGKPIMLIGLLVNGSLCVLLPTLASLGGWMLVCAARMMMGLSQACMYPGTHTLLGQWMPPNERTSMSGFVFGGANIGTIIAMPLSGLLAETSLGWTLIFYTMSGLLFFNSAIYYWFSASYPREHRMIGKEERQYIENSLNTSGEQKSMRTPWKKIFTCVPLYAIIAAHTANNTSFVLFFVDMPTYLKKGLQISLKNSAAFTALPYVGMWIGNTISTFLSQKLLNKKLLSTAASRKLCNSIALFGMGTGLVILSFLGPENKAAAIGTIVLSLTIDGFSNAGFWVNALDLAPNFAGVIISISSFVANLAGILLPIAVSYILRNDPTDVSRWRIVFLMVAAICLVGNTVYLFFARFEQQEWNDPEYFDREKADPEELNILKKQEDDSKPE